MHAFIPFTMSNSDALHPSPATAGGADETSDLVLAMRFAPELLVTRQEFLRSPRRSSPEEGRRWFRHLTIRALSIPKNERKKSKEAERRETRSQRPHPAGCGARGSPRARLSASHHGSLPLGVFHPKAQPGPGFVTQRPNAAGVLPADVALPAMHLARRS